MKQKNERPIALIGNNSNTLQEISSFLQEEKIQVDTVLTVEESKSLFSAENAHVILLCFESIYQAQNFLLTLYSSSDKATILIHEFILLCTKQEAKEAIQLIFNGIIQDYFICKPIYDPNRLFVIIHNSMEHQKIRLKLDRYRNSHHESVELHQNLDKVFHETIESVDSLKNVSQVDISALKRVIDEKLSLFEQDMTDNKYKEAVNIIDKDKLNKYFYNFKKDQIGAEINKYSNNLSNSLIKTIGNIEHDLQNNIIDIDKYITPDNNKLTILIVDDELKNRKILRVILQSKGFNVEEVGDGVEAVNFAIKNQPDLILMDLMMPNLDGFAASKLIHQHDQTKSIPIILITAYPSLENVETSKNIGIKDFIVKPIKAETILKKVNKCLKGHYQ